MIYVDPDGNTEFYFNGKWIGSDGKDNGMIGIVTDRQTKRQIKSGIFPEAIENGKAFKGGFSLHIDVLKESVNVLENAFKSSNQGIMQEHTAVMTQNSNKGYDVKSRGTGAPVGKEESKASAQTESGDVLIHSHILDAWINNEGRSEYYNAYVPSPARQDGTGGDKAVFENYKTNIIVGKNGEPEVKAEYDAIVPNKINRTMIDGRESAINVFDSKATRIGKINKSEATSILKNESKKNP